MKTLRNLFSLLLTLTLLLCTASGAAAETTDDGFVDYVAQLKLNMSSATAKPVRPSGRMWTATRCISMCRKASARTVC